MGFVPFPECGELKYYNAVIRYLSGDYENALTYLMEARKEHGPVFTNIFRNIFIGACIVCLGLRR